jgi:hypothetical protein
MIGESQSDKERLEQLREALNGAFRSLCRDECGTYRLLGSRGHIYRDGDHQSGGGEGGSDRQTDGWLLYVRCRSARHWTFTKRALAFCRLIPRW